MLEVIQLKFIGQMCTEKFLKRISWIKSLPVILLMIGLITGCKKSTDSPTPVTPPSPTPTTNDVDFWLTKGDQSVLLTKQSTVLGFGTTANGLPTIEVDDTQSYQSIDGFGYALTGGSAQAFHLLSAASRQALFTELFGTSASSISISYLRISIGASDLNSSPFSYDDLPTGQTDQNLANFSLAPDMTDLIPIIKEIRAINPSLKILATPWSAPVWMKDNQSFVGGSLLPQYYGVYAQYFVTYLQKMEAEGITVDAITPQNEPLYGGNNPSMLMSSGQQADFIKNYLGPAFKKANLTTKIIIYDHNCDRPDYPIAVLNDATAKGYIDGSAFHLYGGDISALTQVHNAFPDKNLYFTEQYTSSSGNFGEDLKWHMKNVIIGSMRNWSRVALEWNLANNALFGPHTTGGCADCKGAITVYSSDLFARNVSYYIIGHIAKFVPSGSVVVLASQATDLNSVAFKTPLGKKVLIVENDAATSKTFNLKYLGKWVAITLDTGAVGTFIWN